MDDADVRNKLVDLRADLLALPLDHLRLGDGATEHANDDDDDGALHCARH